MDMYVMNSHLLKARKYRVNILIISFVYALNTYIMSKRNMYRHNLAYIIHFLAVFALKTAISGHDGRIQAKNGLTGCLIRAIMPKVLAKVLQSSVKMGSQGT